MEIMVDNLQPDCYFPSFKNEVIIYAACTVCVGKEIVSGAAVLLCCKLNLL